MRIYFYKDARGNFGDDLNAYLWERIAPELFRSSDGPLFVGIGSVLNHRIPQGPKIIFGSGFGYGSVPSVDSSWSIYCVRGPLTAKALRLNPSYVITDPAILAARFVPVAEKKYSVSFMPHHENARHGRWLPVCEALGVNYIDPALPVGEVLLHIAESRVLVSEALHGAIIADALRVPWAPLVTSQNILEFKWHDWCLSMSTCYQPSRLPCLKEVGQPMESIVSEVAQLLLASIESAAWQLSTDLVLAEKMVRLDECLSLLRNDYAGSAFMEAR